MQWLIGLPLQKWDKARITAPSSLFVFVQSYLWWRESKDKMHQGYTGRDQQHLQRCPFAL